MTPDKPAAGQTRLEKHCGYCRKWREAATFSTVIRRRNGALFKVPICKLCKDARKKPSTQEQRDAFGDTVRAELAAEQSARTTILNEKKKTQQGKT